MSLYVSEIFHSLQGETSLTGIPMGFIRLTGCNLRCTYCDTSYAFQGGKPMRISEIVESLESFRVEHVLVTGGEPLLQKEVVSLVDALKDAGYRVSIETHGEISIVPVVNKARIVMDIKTPSSGMCKEGFRENLRYLKPTDEVKFVIASKQDYLWAKSILEKEDFSTEQVLFSPATSAQNTPGEYEVIDPRWLAGRILEDRLPVRMQLQMHKIIWGSDVRGV